jgi:outer membrane protein assembly factor BamB
MKSRLCLAVTMLLAANAVAQAQEWTQFRGLAASGLGTAPNFPAVFSEKDFNWKVELPGAGHSSPVIWGDRVFVTSNPKDTTKRVLSCLSIADGKTLWQKEFASDEFRMHTDNNYAVASPALDAERVYFHWAAPDGSGLMALDQKDGREVWKVDLGPFISQHGPGASPIVFEDLVILNFDPDQPKSFVAAFDANTGKERWRWNHPGTKHTSSTATIFKPGNGAPQVITEGFDTGLVANDARTGALAWQLPGLMTKRCVATPFATPDGLIIAQCGEGRAESFVEIVKPAADGKSAAKLHEIVRVGGYVPTPIVVDGLLYLWKENGLVTCLRTATAEQLWSERVDGSFYGSPVAVNGRLYNMTVKGDLIVLPAGEKFTEPTVIPLGEGSNASAAVSGGRMYLRTFTHLISVGK